MLVLSRSSCLFAGSDNGLLAYVISVDYSFGSPSLVEHQPLPSNDLDISLVDSLQTQDQQILEARYDRKNLMKSAAGSPEPGGFLTPSLSTPFPTATSRPRLILPQPRSRPLKPGSSKECSLISYIDARLLQVSGRYEKRFSARLHTFGDETSPRKGYESFTELVSDLESVIDVVWVSGTRKQFSSPRQKIHVQKN